MAYSLQTACVRSRASVCAVFGNAEVDGVPALNVIRLHCTLWTFVWGLATMYCGLEVLLCLAAWQRDFTGGRFNFFCGIVLILGEFARYAAITLPSFRGRRDLVDKQPSCGHFLGAKVCEAKKAHSAIKCPAIDGASNCTALYNSIMHVGDSRVIRTRLMTLFRCIELQWHPEQHLRPRRRGHAAVGVLRKQGLLLPQGPSPIHETAACMACMAVRCARRSPKAQEALLRLLVCSQWTSPTTRFCFAEG